MFADIMDTRIEMPAILLISIFIAAVPSLPAATICLVPINTPAAALRLSGMKI